MKNQNQRCPLQAECERKCAYVGQELDCDYYQANARGELIIEDQEQLREERWRQIEEQEIAAMEDEEGETPDEEMIPAVANVDGVKIVRTVDVIAAEIRTLTATMLSNIVEIGRRMVEAKELLPHGAFGPWLKENTGFSTSTASNYMRLYMEYSAPQGSLFGAEVNCQTFGSLNYSQALALLDIPASERESFVQEHRVEDMTARELKQAIRERDEAKGRLADVEANLDGLRGDLQAAKEKANAAQRDANEYSKTVDRLRKEIAKLKAKPVDVAVEVDQTAIDHAVEQAAAQLQKKWDEDKERKDAEIDKLTKHLQTVLSEKERADNALEQANQELADVQAKLEEAKKPKENSQKDKEVAEFGVYFEQTQDLANKLRGLLLKARARNDMDTAKKLEQALKALGEAIGRAAS